ncbi:Crp/Fnr family transcriptional regulator [Devosia sp. WQ 349]|uniref:Crp/Fnr family transcriptional regulator n=1 Tax=Devosia sp. WQ 349K1 TaxID=2800329 RepID=UPI001903B741|nr:Crp/Fnr family transcriptional regulator [Devosia sp. WQ 349K1]MBK1796048.1 Crp/Fnr family transcriptional regulator [Devosia sp. WQ 349K1]
MMGLSASEINTRPKDPPLFRRFTSTGLLDRTDTLALAQLPWSKQSLAPHDRFEANQSFSIVAAGILCRENRTPEGRRQLLGMILPGDVCNYSLVTGLKPMTTQVAMVRSTVLTTDLDRLTALIELRPRILSALLAHLTIDNAMTEELVLSLGCRSALERMAHFLCEIDYRLGRMGLSENHQFTFSLTQAELGHYLGLSAVHVNRTLQELRRRKLISTQGSRVALTDIGGLKAVGGFSPAYLTGTPAFAHRLGAA